jgi:D-tyrosyl-tRNA(Tyr) deacylase
MKTVIQRISSASVTIDSKIVAEIQNGLLVLVGIEDADTQEDLEWLAAKIANLRIFGDENEVMNLSVKDIEGEIIVVSQFTLHASTKKGNRPSYIKASKPDIAIPIYEKFVKQLEVEIAKKVQTGVFGADMKVALINDGPVTIFIDSYISDLKIVR